MSDYLGNAKDFQKAEIQKAAIEAELSSTQDNNQRQQLQQALNQVNDYLDTHQRRYNTWKEGGIGRSILHGATGGLTTGNIGGVLAASGTSLAAPYRDKAGDKLGTAGKALADTLGGAAIGYVSGGNAGAAVGANTDWNNRQLHPKEMALADKYAEAFKREVEKKEGRKISSTEAAMRIRRQILRWVDKTSQDGYTDQAVISFLGMKGEDKALGYTWDYRQYADRNPAAYNSPILFAEYRIREKPQYRDLKWFHSGIKNSEIQREQQANENFALNATDFLSNFVNPNPRVKAPILAGVRHLKNIKPTVTGNDPLLAGAGNIRIPANGNAPKENRIPDTALAAKNHQKNDSRTSKGQAGGSSIPVPQATQVKFGSEIVTYKSNPKHTPGSAGWNIKAGKEPRNSLSLFKESHPIPSSTTVRFTRDTDGNIHRFSRDHNNQWHWSGGTGDINNPLKLDNKVKSDLRNLGWNEKVLK